MNFLNDQGATNLISLALVVITGVYVYLTRQIARANHKQIEAAHEQFQETIRPFIVARIAVRHSVFLALEIENIGKTPAQNLRLEINKAFYQFAEHQESHNIQTFEAFTKPIPTFSPSQILRFDLSQGFNLNVEKNGVNLTPMQFDLTANYSAKFGTYSDVFHIDIAPYFHTHTPRNVADRLEEIEKQLKAIVQKL